MKWQRAIFKSLGIKRIIICPIVIILKDRAIFKDRDRHVEVVFGDVKKHKKKVA